jgi:predicted permease
MARRSRHLSFSAKNLLTFTVGLIIAAWAGSELSGGGGGLSGGMKALFRLPTIPTLAAALLARGWIQSGHVMPPLIAITTDYLSKGMIPTALVTLGAQLAVKPRWPRWKPVSMVLVLRLLLGPVQMAALLYGLHLLHVPALDLWPWPAESLILTAAVPTAVNTLLLTLEVGGDADLAADCVFWTTMMSCVTITAWLVVIRRWIG